MSDGRLGYTKAVQNWIDLSLMGDQTIHSVRYQAERKEPEIEKVEKDGMPGVDFLEPGQKMWA